MKVSFIRGKYLNNFEGQNYDMSGYDDVQFVGYSSLRPIDDNVPFDVVRLPSLVDLGASAHVGRVLSYVANRSIGDIQVLFGLERHIEGSDIVHTADAHYYYSYQAALLRQQAKIGKLVTTSWETIPHNNEGTAQKKKRKYYVMKHTDQFICHTQKAREALLTEGVDPLRITVIPLGVNMLRFTPIQYSKNNRPCVLFVGRLVNEKGVLEVYSAFRSVYKDIGGKITLRIVGEGPLYTKLLHAISVDGMNHVVSIEKKKYADMPKVFRSATLLVAPSRKHPTWEEQYGMVFIEAMAVGLPIITTRTGAIEEVVGECGLYVNETSEKEIALAMKKLLTDTSKRQKIGTMGRSRAVAQYDARNVSRKMYKLYDSLLLRQ